MSKPTLGIRLLRIRLVLLRANPLTLAFGLLFVAVTGSFAWMLHAVSTLDAAHTHWKAEAVRVAPPVHLAAAPPPKAAPDNLTQFYTVLGQRRYVEQQVKTLFALAAQNGLTLAQGEYKRGYDGAAHLHTYQINLPVKGSYQAIWRFTMGALRAIPFAALDDIGFWRDTIGDPQVEARLRLTLYLTDGSSGPGSVGVP